LVSGLGNLILDFKMFQHFISAAAAISNHADVGLKILTARQPWAEHDSELAQGAQGQRNAPLGHSQPFWR